MKIYISVDMEGIAGVTHVDHAKLEGLDYEEARKWTTGEANAAIEGAFAAGANEIVVADSHGYMKNLIPDELHEAVTFVQGSPRPLLMVGGLDETFDAAIFIGYHARHGDPIGVLAHSMSGMLINEIRLNQEPVGETVFNAAVAGHFGVPVALVAGDDALAAEVQEKLPWVESVVTKWALSSTSARNLTPKASQEKIRAAARAALGDLANKKSFKLPSPIRLEVDFKSSMHAFLVSDIPGVEKKSGVSVSYTGGDMLEISRIFRLMLKVAS